MLECSFDGEILLVENSDSQHGVPYFLPSVDLELIHQLVLLDTCKYHSSNGDAF